jgi:hypothetical protein
LAIGLDTTLSELRNNIAWHNGNILRIVLAAVMGGWDMDGFCDAVADLVNANQFRKLFKRCTVTPYKKEAAGKLLFVLGAHHNEAVHALEMMVTDGGIDCVFYRVFRAFLNGLHEGMFPPRDQAPIHVMYVEDDSVLRQWKTSLWELLDPKADRTNWPFELTTTYESMHEGEPPANVLFGAEGFHDCSFNRLTHAEAEIYRILTASLLGRFVPTYDSRSHDSGISKWGSRTWERKGRKASRKAWHRVSSSWCHQDEW